ncbi:MAG: hypothetical protein LBU27_06010 [Candidatus Peribacteria bacterium]|jgi:hypothetical protein|nr:hypothetical protein [Candidatus Peribacteria bacterium]
MTVINLFLWGRKGIVYRGDSLLGNYHASWEFGIFGGCLPYLQQRIGDEVKVIESMKIMKSEKKSESYEKDVQPEGKYNQLTLF